MILKMVVATAMKTITSTHQGMMSSGCCFGGGISGPDGVDFNGAGPGAGWGDGGVSGADSSSVDDAGDAVDSGVVYFTVPICCSLGRKLVASIQASRTLALASTIFPITW